MRDAFQYFSHHAAKAMGSSFAFVAAILVVVIWALTGPLFDYSDTWQLVINTGTTIITFIMIFLVQNSQNRDTAAVQLKLDELLRSVEKARNDLIDLEELPEDQIERLHEEFHRLANGRDARTMPSAPAPRQP